MLNSPIGRLRLAGFLEGSSFLYLLCVAMPQKWIGGNDEAIKIPGWVHGGLFILLCGALFLAWKPAGWSVKTCAKVFLAALLPFGPFVIEPWLRREERRVRGSS
jgi:integral membrane protein